MVQDQIIRQSCEFENNAQFRFSVAHRPSSDQKKSELRYMVFPFQAQNIQESGSKIGLKISNSKNSKLKMRRKTSK